MRSLEPNVILWNRIETAYFCLLRRGHRRGLGLRLSWQMLSLKRSPGFNLQYHGKTKHCGACAGEAEAGGSEVQAIVGFIMSLSQSGLHNTLSQNTKQKQVTECV